MADFVDLGFELAFRYRTPVMMLSDGIIGQMMEKVCLPPQKPRRTEAQIQAECPWATTGRTAGRKNNILTSLELQSEEMERRNLALQAKYAEIRLAEVRWEERECADAEVLVVAFGSAARIAEKSVQIAREEGLRVGLFRPITLWPFPTEALAQAARGKRGVLVAEMNAGQMVEDVRLALAGTGLPVHHFGRLGGIVPEPTEIAQALTTHFPTA